MRKRWMVQCIDREGEVRAEERFWLRRQAKSFAAWQAATATGSHWFLTPMAKEMLETRGPLWTVEVRRVRN